MKKYFLLSLVALLFATPAWATWTFVSGKAGDKEPTITDGSWTIKVYSNSTNPGFISYTENGANGILDLSTIKDDTTMVITSVDGTMKNGASYLRKVIMPDSVTTINNEAFRNCTLLEEVVFPNNLTFVGAAAFAGCTSLRTGYPLGTTNPETGTLLLPESLTTFDNWGTFSSCESIQKVVARGLTTVINRAFESCTSLGEVEVSTNVVKLLGNGTYWNHGAFYNCTSLTNFYPTVFCARFETGGNGYYGPFALAPIRTTFDFSKTQIETIPAQWNRAGNILGAIFPATLKTIEANAFCWQQTGGAKFRFLGDIPSSFGGSGDNTPFYPKGGAFGPKTTGTAYRHVFVVDAKTYPAWTNSAKFVKMSDVATSSIGNVKNYFSYESADFPTPDHPEETLGVTEDGSANGRYNWLVQYVDHTAVAVTWMNGDQEFSAATSVEIGDAPTAPDETPSKASTAEFDYTFIGWNIDPNATTALDLATLALNEATTFYAIYSSATRSYEITWKRDAETVLDTTTVLYGVVPTHADASKDADETHSYRFEGWSTDGSTVFASLPAVTGAATYIAVFTPLSLDTSVTVSWFDEDGTTPLDPATTTVEKGAKPTHAEPTKAATVDTAYTFAGWTQVGGDGPVYTTANLPAASANVSYKAVYSSATRQYTVTFANWDGTIVTETLYDYNTPATAVVVPECPLRPATAEYTYAFTGWSPAAVADVVSDATYTAQYSSTPNEYTAIFVNGQTGETVSSVALAYGSAVTAPEPPEVDGYTFVKWSPAVDTMPPANTTYTAIYTINKYTITWKNANGATLGTTTVEHGAMPAYGGTAPSLSNTSKLGYTFTGWTPEIVAATEATTYTAAYKVAFLSPMTIALDSTAYDKGTGEATVVTEVGNTDAAATTTAEATAQFKTTSVTGEATVDGTTVTSVFDNFASGRGYEWTITATQTYGAEYSGASESASIKGRTYARTAKSWFDNAAVPWNEGAFAPAAQSGSGAQVRMRATVTFPAVLPRALPSATDAAGAVVGITACQPNAGVAPCYYAWDGAQWVRLAGVAPKGGVAVKLLGVVDFARKDGPAVAWYADGFQLTTAKGDWEVPLAGGTKLTSFGLVGDLTVGSLSGDYDVGGLGFSLIIR